MTVKTMLYKSSNYISRRVCAIVVLHYRYGRCGAVIVTFLHNHITFDFRTMK